MIQWLRPGLRVKRWLGLLFLGMLLCEQLAHAAIAMLVVDAVDFEGALRDVVGDCEQMKVADQAR